MTAKKTDDPYDHSESYARSQIKKDIAVARAHDRAYDSAELIRLVWKLILEEQFEPADFVLAGSARLLITGHRKRLSDIDIIARGDTWQRTLDLVRAGHGYFERTKVSGAMVARLCGGRIEVCDHWFMPGSKTDRLIDEADVHEGLRYFTLREVAAYKRVLDRPKDRADLRAISAAGPFFPNPPLLSPLSPAGEVAPREDRLVTAGR